MPRFVLALFVAFAAAIFAAPAAAHVHGDGHRGHATSEPIAAPHPRPAAPVKIAAAIEAATPVLTAAIDPTCDRDCGHAAGGSVCLCMAACVAVALPDLPALARLAAAAMPLPSDAPVWRALSHGPPTPPPRA